MADVVLPLGITGTYVNATSNNHFQFNIGIKKLQLGYSRIVTNSYLKQSVIEIPGFLEFYNLDIEQDEISIGRLMILTNRLAFTPMLGLARYHHSAVPKVINFAPVSSADQYSISPGIYTNVLIVQKIDSTEFDSTDALGFELRVIGLVKYAHKPLRSDINGGYLYFSAGVCVFFGSYQKDS